MRILIVKLSSLGDIFHALPTVHNLKVATGAAVDWVTQTEYVEMVRCFPDVERVLAVNRRAFPAGFRAWRSEIRAVPYDLVIDLQGLLKSAFVARLARSRRVIGPSFAREGSALFYTERAGAPDLARHAVDQNLDVVSHLGLPRLPPVFPVRFPAAGRTEPRPRVGLLPLSRWPSKNWPLERFGELGRRLREAHPVSLYLLGGPADVAACAVLAQAVGGSVTNLAGRTNLIEMGGVLQALDLLVANDTGPVHMAVAVGTPTVSIYGPTLPLRTGPYGPGHTVVRATVGCQPCTNRQCPRPTTPCMDAVTVDEVFSAVMAKLG